MESLKSTQLLLRVLAGRGEGYCLFNCDDTLHSWNEVLVNDMPEWINQLECGLPYSRFLSDVLNPLVVSRVGRACERRSNAASVQFPQIEEIMYECGLTDDRWMHVSRVELPDQNWLLLFNNITVQKKEREALVLSEEKFKRFARLSCNWFWELDENLCYLYHSTHQGAMFTDDASSVVGIPRIDSLLPRVADTAQLREHNACLLAHKSIDVVLSWICEGGDKVTYSHVLAEPRYDSRGKFIGYIGCGRDVTASYEMSAEFEFQANHDHLTGLKNRRAFERYLDGLINRSDKKLSDSRYEKELHDQYTLVLIDLDRFKLINDDVGHAAGDQLLVQVSRLLQTIVGNSGMVARIGGDEFGVCLMQEIGTAEKLVDAIIEEISMLKFEWKNRPFSIGASAGLVAFNPALATRLMLLKNADAACYSAKMLGRNRKELFSNDNFFQTQQSEELNVLRTIRSAMDDDRVVLYVQPIVTASDVNVIDKFEILMRVSDEFGNTISPGKLIPTAEKYDVMHLVDLRVMEKTIANIRKYLAVGADVSFSINLSGNTLGNEKYMHKIVNLVKDQSMLGKCLCFEITETAAINSLDTVVYFMNELRRYGCQFSLDDFGSGLASYGYLESLQVDYIKIDGSFVKKIEAEKTSQAIVKSITTLSREMGIETVAECVENQSIAESAIALNVDYLQGYYYGKPVSIDELLSFYAVSLGKTGTG